MDIVTEPRKYVVLSKDELEGILLRSADVGAKAALEKADKEKKRIHKEVLDKRLRNTKLLLRNYRMLKENADSSIYSNKQIEDSTQDIFSILMDMEEDELIIESIKRSKVRTAIMVSHIDNMLAMYKIHCEGAFNELEKRRYDIIFDMYISDSVIDVKEIAKKYYMSKENVYVNLRTAVECMSILFFGIDGIHFH